MGVTAVLLLVVATASLSRAHQQDEARLTCTAFAASTGGPWSSPVATSVDIVVDRWSSAAEHQRLLEALTRSQNAMLETLREMPRVGYIRTPTALGWPLRYARARPGEERERRIVIATDRPIEFGEAFRRERTLDYPFTFVELRVIDGEGSGTLSYATQVYATNEGRFIQLESYGVQPIQLNEVKCRGSVEVTEPE